MSLFSTLLVSASGMSAERTRAEVLAENIANADTTRTAEGGPYRRRDVLFQSEPVASDFSSVFETAFQDGTQGVAVSQIVTDNSDPILRYMPGHPDADKNGYVAFPRVNPAEDMVDLVETARAYQANVSAISAIKDMIARSIDLFR
jgi:flagellar basal-body rod protein FlgC